MQIEKRMVRLQKKRELGTIKTCELLELETYTLKIGKYSDDPKEREKFYEMRDRFDKLCEKRKKK